MTTLLLVAALPLSLHLHSVPPRLSHTSRISTIRCGWGPDPIWTPNDVVSIKDAAKGLKAITIMPPKDTASGYTIPGQYLQLREPGAEKAGIFAIASAPGADGAFEFLIKEQPPSNWSPGTGWLTSGSAGLKLEMSQVMGSGFKIAPVLDQVDSVLLFAAGSGISPIRSTIESGMLAGKEVRLYYGARTLDMMAYQDKFAAWEKLGVSVTPVISKPEGTSWKGATGYVQEIAKEIGVPKRSAILVCGMKGMFEGVKALAKEAGLADEMVMANF